MITSSPGSIPSFRLYSAGITSRPPLAIIVLTPSGFFVGKMKSYRDKVAALLGARVFRPAWFPERVMVVSVLQKCGKLEICC
ncbi:MAG: hypothetical protein RIR86_311 [Acidobacteriota bacterium]